MRKYVIIWVAGMLLGCGLVQCARASDSPIWDNLLSALFVEGGGVFEYAPDPKDGYGTAVHMEPRYNLGAGFSFDVTDRVECDLGYRWQDMPPLPGRVHDTLDKSHSFYMSFRFHPFRKD